MSALRRHLGKLAATVFSLQLCLLAAAPSALCVESVTKADADCTCAHGDGSCPLHHHTPSTQKSPCSCRSTADPQSGLVAALLGPIAVLTPGVHLEQPVPFGSVTVIVSPSLDTLSIPDSPPPRL